MAKVLVEISEEELKRMRANTNKFSSTFIILNGIVLDGLTNGEAMQTLFNMSLDDFKHTWGGGDYTNDWWNAKWGE